MSAEQPGLTSSQALPSRQFFFQPEGANLNQQLRRAQKQNLQIGVCTPEQRRVLEWIERVRRIRSPETDFVRKAMGWDKHAEDGECYIAIEQPIGPGDRDSKVCCINGDPFNQCRMNLKYAWKDLGLHIVAGSFGIGKKRPAKNKKKKKRVPYFEFGGEHYQTRQDFAANGTDNMDIYYWLEDASGNVYDLVTPYLVAISIIHNKPMDFNVYEVVYGETKDACAKKGLFYVSAPSSVQDMVWEVWASKRTEHTDTPVWSSAEGCYVWH